MRSTLVVKKYIPMSTHGLNLALAMLGFLSLNACIGVIEDTSNELTDARIAPSDKISFAGAEFGAGTSHQSVEISFKPASGGSGKFAYRVYMNGSESSTTTLSASSAVLNSAGFLTARVSGISGTNKFSVKAFDVINTVEDANVEEISVSVLSDKTPIFSGVREVKNIAGTSGKTQLEVLWTIAEPAEVSPNPFAPDPFKISGYVIDLATSEQNLAAPVDGVNHIQVFVSGATTSSFVVNSLQPGVNYFVRVRAEDSHSPKRQDLNNTVLQKKTLSDQPIQFAGLKTAGVPTDSSGFSKVTLNWDAGTGSYSRYRVFLSTDPVSAFDPVEDTPFINDITDLSTVSKTIDVAQPHTVYYLAVVACSDADCASYAGHNVVKTVRTTPPVSPFNGIKAHSAPSGPDSLTSINLTWDAPSTVLGVYDEIRIFKTNSFGVYNPATNALPEYDNANPSVIGITGLSATGVTIKGLTTGQEACFVAKAYATTPQDPTAPLGRTHNSEKLVCLTPEYVSPGFAGITSGCRNKTSTSFTVDWAAPNPTGIYAYYEVYYNRTDSGLFSFTQAIEDYNDGIINTPASDYVRTTVAANTNTLTLTDLRPNTEYSIGVKTFFQNPLNSQVFRDANLVSTKCKSDTIKVEHQGWEEIFAIGPKINGLAVPPAPMLERIPIPGEDGVPGGGIDNMYNHRYPQEHPNGVEGVNASKSGIVRLHWKDMVLSAGLGTVYAFNGPNSGYKIFRKLYRSSHDQVPPTIVGDVSEGAWESLTPDPIPAKRFNNGGQFYNYGEFVDYTLSRAGLQDNETLTYWYKVEVFIDGVKVDFQTTPPDGVVKIVVPPNNMALMHRWMANKEFCGKLERPSLRAQNYSCLYNGIASTNGYYDMGYHTLVDRFMLGCNFTRGNSPNKCTATGSSFKGTGNSTNPGTLQGDCLVGGTSTGNWDLPDNWLSAAKDAVVFVGDRWGGSCFINLNGGNATSSWRAIHQFDYFHGAGQNWSQIVPNKVRLPDASDKFIAGLGLGKIASTNNSKMPSLGNLSPYVAQSLCHSHKVLHNGEEHLKRLPRNKERSRYEEMSHWLFLQSNWNRERFRSGQRDVQTGTVLDRDFDNKTTKTYAATVDLTNLNDWGYQRITGTAGEFSREAASGRYGHEQGYRAGLQEVYGDLLYCNQTWGCSFKYTDAAQTVPLTNPWDPDAQEDWKSSNNQYYNLLYDPVGFVTFRTITWFGYTMWPFFSEAMTLPLNCNGSSCITDGLINDDKHFATGSAGGVINNYAPVTYNATSNTRSEITDNFSTATEMRAVSRSSNFIEEIKLDRGNEISQNSFGARCAVEVD